MKWHVGPKLTTALLLACAAMAIVSLGALWIANRLFDEARWVEHTHVIIAKTQALNAAMREAESVRRAAALSPSSELAGEFAVAMEKSRVFYEELWDLTEDNPEQRNRLTAINTLMNERHVQLENAFKATESEANLPVKQWAAIQEGMALANEFHAALIDFEESELNLLEARRERRDSAERNTMYALTAGMAFGFIVLLTCMMLLNQQVLTRQLAEKELRNANEQMTRWITELESRNAEISALGELGHILQACRNRSETYDAVQSFLERAFPGTSGALCITRSSRNLVSVEARWGDHPPGNHDFDPQSCWALRMGRPHVTRKEAGIGCSHHDRPVERSFTCMPMSALGETLGTMVLADIDLDDMDEAKRNVVESVARGVGMALSNLLLREQLLNQSITDSLTGLFNRRYLEESLRREISRANRSKHGVGVMLIDVDHFKSFNDKFGHQAGDAVLKSFGQILKSRVRGSDLACRYGGEEFALLLPESDFENTCRRAEEIASEVQGLSVLHNGETLPAITVSIGVCSFPEHGSAGELLIAQADKALYRAKAEGRNRVCVAPPGSPQQSLTTDQV
ncbi:MAG: hypothetical protein AMXMBFR84_43850 [Candidatus Hydrogenedentota bacterium]